MESLDLDGAAWRQRLQAGAAELGLRLDDAQTLALSQFALRLRERNAQVNLTSIVSPEGILTLHMLDSLSVVPYLREARRVLDVGTGGGFPGIPLAVACPQTQFLLIDGTQKKIRFVSESIEALRLGNAQARAARAEDLARDEVFDVVIARAVASLAELVHNAGKRVAPQGRLLAMKGRLPEDELQALPRGWQAEVIPLRVPGLEAERHLVQLTRAPAKAKPRGDASG